MLQGYGIINLFLLANLITTTSTLPVLAGLITHRWAHRLVTPATMLFGCLLGFVSLIVYARIQQPHWGLSLSGALHNVFIESYDWPPFILALGKPPHPRVLTQRLTICQLLMQKPAGLAQVQMN